MPHNTPESKYLGKRTAIPSHYAPEVLVSVPRAANREALGLNTTHRLEGWDVWHAYEAGFLAGQGLPVTGVLKIVYDANTENLVESKSLKLYLNSFNEEKMGHTPGDAITTYEHRVKTDLEKTTGGEVRLRLHQYPVHYQEKPWQHYAIAERMPGVEQIPFTATAEDPQLLQTSYTPDEQHLLKSNCKITHQPDWGSAFLHMKGATLLPFSFLQYIASLRTEDHFHEEIAELLMKRLIEKSPQSDIMVACHYTRRGGIDINPVRFKGNHRIPAALTNEKILTTPLFRQ
jgi:7-cyano-7-deazaguanine reductase